MLSRELDAGAALGACRIRSHSIALRPDVPALQELKTLTHETHALLHRDTIDRMAAELEAESCAFLVLHDLELDTSSYSFAYLAHWADSLEALTAAGERASQAATRILDALSGPNRSRGK